MGRNGSRIDSGLASILAMALITSGLIVLTMAGERIDDPIVVIKNLHPTRLYTHASVTTREKMDFEFSILSRREFATLEIMYSTLVQGQPVFAAMGDASMNMTDLLRSNDLAYLAGRIETVSALKNETDNEHMPPDVLSLEVSIHDTEHGAIFYDFPLVRMYSDPSLSGSVATSFLVLQNGSEPIYLLGYSDFFINRLGGFENALAPTGEEITSSIAKLRIRRDYDVASYSSGPGLSEGWHDIADLPPFGIVSFADVGKNERLSIDFTIETPERPEGMIAQVVRVYGDGELLEVVTNFIG